jgi:hypothetical protein
MTERKAHRFLARAGSAGCRICGDLRGDASHLGGELADAMTYGLGPVGFIDPLTGLYQDGVGDQIPAHWIMLTVAQQPTALQCWAVFIGWLCCERFRPQVGWSHPRYDYYKRLSDRIISVTVDLAVEHGMAECDYYLWVNRSTDNDRQGHWVDISSDDDRSSGWRERQWVRPDGQIALTEREFIGSPGELKVQALAHLGIDPDDDA